MRFAVVAAALALAAVAGCARDQGMASTTAAPMVVDDRTFVEMAASSGMYEVQSSQLALENGTDPSIRQFAQMMVNDHTRANDELMAIAHQAGMAPSPGMNDKHAAMYRELQQAQRGSGFDRRYAEQQTMAHREAIDLFQAEIRSGQNTALRAFANRTLPTLQQHHQLVRGMAR